MTPLIMAILERGFTRTESGCLEYNGHRNDLGYGLIRFGGKSAPLMRVHRAMYEHYTGEVLTPAIKILHSCDNPSCSAREHLRAGTQAENLADMRAKGRGYKQDWTRCPNGHPYPEDRPPASTKNRCRECNRERNRRYERRKRDDRLAAH